MAEKMERVSHLVSPPDYAAVEVEIGGAAERRGGSASRRALVMAAVGAAMAVCCVAAVGGGWAGGDALALGIKRMALSARAREDKILEKQSTEGLVIGKSVGKKVQYFTLDSDPAIGSQSSSWAYSGATGPSAWAGVAPEFALCASGQMQSPVNIVRADEKAHLDLPTLRWQGYEAEPFVEQGMETRAFFDGHSICMGGPATDPNHPTGEMTGPRLAVYGFSRYLPDLPLSAVAIVNYTLHEIRFHTPAEHQIDGQSFPFEMQMVHECNALTVPSCPINKTMIVSVLFTEARTGWGEESPAFLSSLLDDLRLIEGVWSQYVASYAFDFGRVSFPRAGPRGHAFTRGRPNPPHSTPIHRRPTTHTHTHTHTLRCAADRQGAPPVHLALLFDEGVADGAAVHRRRDVVRAQGPAAYLKERPRLRAANPGQQRATGAALERSREFRHPLMRPLRRSCIVSAYVRRKVLRSRILPNMLPRGQGCLMSMRIKRILEDTGSSHRCTCRGARRAPVGRSRSRTS